MHREKTLGYVGPWLFIALAVARVITIAVMGFFGARMLVGEIMLRLIPTALVSDAALIIAFLALKKQSPAVRVAGSALIAYAASFAVEAALGRLPEGRALLVAFVVSVSHGALFLGGLYVWPRWIRWPVVAVGVWLFTAIMLASLVGDALTFVALSGGAAQLPYLTNTIWLNLRHATFFALIVTGVLALRR